MLRALTAALLVGLIVIACASLRPVPSIGAPPRDVLVAYLDALVANDCASARQFVVQTFTKGSGELCGAVRVTRASIVDGDPAMPNPTEVEFATTLTTNGDGASIPPGDITWFVVLDRQPNGAWRITGGGSGP